MDMQIMLLLFLLIGAAIGFIGGKVLGPRRQRGFLPYIFGGAVGANVGGFVTRGVFGIDAHNVGEPLALAGAAVGAALFILLAHLIPVRQTVNHM